MKASDHALHGATDAQVWRMYLDRLGRKAARGKEKRAMMHLFLLLDEQNEQIARLQKRLDDIGNSSGLDPKVAKFFDGRTKEGRALAELLSRVEKRLAESGPSE